MAPYRLALAGKGWNSSSVRLHDVLGKMEEARTIFLGVESRERGFTAEISILKRTEEKAKAILKPIALSTEKAVKAEAKKLYLVTKDLVCLDF